MFPPVPVLVILLAVTAGAVYLSWISARDWRGDRYLCDDCKYNNPDDCQKPERPKAIECTAYHPKA